jgi:DNA-binding winged helix-turn-helix (wHTH) protein/TolB-like protein
MSMDLPGMNQAHYENAYLLGEWQVFPDVGILIRDGQQVHAEPKVMSVLVCLLQAEGRLVTREELIEKVWAHVVINDEVLTRAISELRTMLGDVGRERRYIITIPKRGYKLVMAATPITVCEVSDGGMHSKAVRRLFSSLEPAALLNYVRSALSRPSGLAASFVLSSLLAFAVWMTPDGTDKQASSATPRIVSEQAAQVTTRTTHPVLIQPLTPITDDEQTRIFAAGLSEDLQYAIYRLTDLQVVQQLSQTNLENALILSGSVRVYDQSTKVNFQLVDAASSRLLWSGAFECPLDALMTVQTLIARQAGEHLQRSWSSRKV